MIILLFGVSNVGKSETGKLLAEKLGYLFYDLDDEVKAYYHTSIEDFVHTGTLRGRDRKRGIVLNKLMRQSCNQVIAVTPMSYPENFTRHLTREDVLAIELLDEPENIFQRLVFSDENDRVYRDDEYRDAHKKYYLSEIRADLQWYGTVYKVIKNKFHMQNDGVETVVDRIIAEYQLKKQKKMCGTYEIREAVPEDYPDIHRLNVQEMRYDFPLEDTKIRLSRIICSSRDKVFVAVSDGAVVGYVHANDYDVIYAPHMKNIMGIAVSDDHKRQGIGRQLLMRVEKWALETDAKAIRLVSGSERKEAHRFYEACGYIRKKQQENFRKTLR